MVKLCPERRRPRQSQGHLCGVACASPLSSGEASGCARPCENPSRGVSCSAGMGRPSRKPWTSSHCQVLRCRQFAAVSTPRQRRGGPGCGPGRSCRERSSRCLVVHSHHDRAIDLQLAQTQPLEVPSEEAPAPKSSRDSLAPRACNRPTTSTMRAGSAMTMFSVISGPGCVAATPVSSSRHATWSGKRRSRRSAWPGSRRRARWGAAGDSSVRPHAGCPGEPGSRGR